MLADGWNDRDRGRDRLRLALVSAGIDPDGVDQSAGVDDSVEEWTGDPADDADVNFDYSAVDWAPDASADEWERMQAALANTRMQISDPEPDAVKPPTVPDVEFDREWI